MDCNHYFINIVLFINLYAILWHKQHHISRIYNASLNILLIFIYSLHNGDTITTRNIAELPRVFLIVTNDTECYGRVNIGPLKAMAEYCLLSNARHNEHRHSPQLEESAPLKLWRGLPSKNIARLRFPMVISKPWTMAMQESKEKLFIKKVSSACALAQFCN